VQHAFRILTYWVHWVIVAQEKDPNWPL